MAITMLAGYLVIINAAALLMMAEDKRRVFGPEAAPGARAGSRAVWRSPARRQRRGMGGHVSVPPQNQALVFCGGYAADSGRTAGRWGVAGREQRPGLNNRNALPEQ